MVSLFGLKCIWGKLLKSLLLGQSVLLLVIVATTSSATPEDQTRDVLDRLSAAHKAKDVGRVGDLLSKDCVVVMTEPGAGASQARFFTRDTYFKLLAQRFSQTTATSSKQAVHSVSTSEAGDVFVVVDYEERARINQRSEWIRSHEYIVMRPVGDDMLVRLVVAEMIFYAPGVPPNPQDTGKQ